MATSGMCSLGRLHIRDTQVLQLVRAAGKCLWIAQFWLVSGMTPSLAVVIYDKSLDLVSPHSPTPWTLHFKQVIHK